MNHDRLKSVPLAMACAAVLAWPVSQAQAADVSASVGDLTFTLVDLDPNDGIEPSITWTALSGDVFTSARSGMQVVWADEAQGIWSPGHATVHPDGIASDTSTPFPTLATASASAQASLTPSSLSVAYASPSDGGQGSAGVNLLVGFMLSPRTQLELSGRLAYSLQAPDGDQAALPEGASSSANLTFASASVYMDVALDVWSPWVLAPESWFDFESVSALNSTVSTNPTGDTAPFSLSLDRSFAHTLRNDSNEGLGGAFRSLVSVYGGQLATQAGVVPEPSGLGLVVAGALVGWVARRRRLVSVA